MMDEDEEEALFARLRRGLESVRRDAGAAQPDAASPPAAQDPELIGAIARGGSLASRLGLEPQIPRPAHRWAGGRHRGPHRDDGRPRHRRTARRVGAAFRAHPPPGGAAGDASPGHRAPQCRAAPRKPQPGGQPTATAAAAGPPAPDRSRRGGARRPRRGGGDTARLRARRVPDRARDAGAVGGLAGGLVPRSRFAFVRRRDRSSAVFHPGHAARRVARAATRAAAAALRRRRRIRFRSSRRCRRCSPLHRPPSSRRRFRPRPQRRRHRRRPRQRPLSCLPRRRRSPRASPPPAATRQGRRPRSRPSRRRPLRQWCCARRRRCGWKCGRKPATCFCAGRFRPAKPGRFPPIRICY